MTRWPSISYRPDEVVTDQSSGRGVSGAFFLEMPPCHQPWRSAPTAMQPSAPARPPRARRSGQRPPACSGQRARRPASRGSSEARGDDRADAWRLGPPLQRGGCRGPAGPASIRPPLCLGREPAGCAQGACPARPGPEKDGCVAWRARDLCDVVERRFGVRYREAGMLRLLKGLNLSWQKARPVHPEADPVAQERFKKLCPA